MNTDHLIVLGDYDYNEDILNRGTGTNIDGSSHGELSNEVSSDELN